MKYSQINLLALLCLLFIPFVKLQAQGKEGYVVDKIVAKVDNYVVLKSEVEKGYLQMQQDKLNLGANPRCVILEQLIVNKILLAKAEIDSVIVDDSQIESEMARRMQYFVAQFGSEDKMQQVLGKTTVELREELRDQVKEQLTVQRMQSEITSSISVTPAQVKKYFNSIPKDSIPFLSAEVQVGQIVKNPEVSRSEKEKVKQKLLDLKQQLLDGAEFAALARKYSEDYGSAAKGGDLGWHGRGELVSEFEATALRIDPEEIADPVESEFGFHLIQLMERRGNRFKARHILIRPKANSDDVEGAKVFLDSLRNMILLDSISFESAAKEHSDDQLTRSNAGFFKDNSTGSSIISTDALDPVIFFTIDTMKVENITKPIPFRTEDGKDAARIIYYKSYKPPHYANIKDDYQKLYLNAINQEKAQILSEWLKKAKEEVFIDIDPEYDKCQVMSQL